MKPPHASNPAWWTRGLSLLAVLTTAAAAEPGPTAGGAAKVDYERDIRPIFEAACIRCHGPERPKSRFRLDNAASALKGGAVNTNDIVPFRSHESLLIDYVSGRDEEMMMPPAGKGDPLTPGQIALLRDWIDQGALWSAASMVAARPSSLSLTPVIGWIEVSGNQQKYRADTGKPTASSSVSTSSSCGSRWARTRTWSPPDTPFLTCTTTRSR